ncbi:hypothetical protein RD792_008530 [Penstemon davidsonii]|uniref:RING-type domain-containing protein n=1 Tax=Penstemon davidsonii TaxID=160366 RepID=A0ABR0DA07_9LAMI|nr:hypothetical protein RD792_008530 [Penstemon davidsonii]
MDVEREGGRGANQLRPMDCTRNVLSRAHGSASCSNGETRVLAAVYGPKAGTKKNENPEKACIEVIWKPKTGQIACAALVDAGIPLKYFAVAICCSFSESGHILLDPNKLEEQKMKALVYLAFPSSVRSVLTEGSVNGGEESAENGIITSLTHGVMPVAYAKYCHSPEPYDPNEAQQPGRIIRSRSRFSGIDRTVIESLPFFRFSSLKGSKEGLECAVCLSKFEETEILRLLPKCRHAFHMNCIDQWLENHSSCPICRYKFDISDLKSLTYTNSFRKLHNYTEEPNLEFFIQREKNLESSSRFSLSNAIEKFSRGKKEEFLIQNEGKFVHNVKHKIIVSDVMHRSRWSDVNSSDMISLSSEMLNVVSSKRFSSMESSGKEHILKIKDDMERKRLYESKFDKIESSTSLSNSNIELEQSTMLNSLDSSQKRSMSEITNVSRFRELNVMSIQTNMEKGDEIRKSINNNSAAKLQISRSILQAKNQTSASSSIIPFLFIKKSISSSRFRHLRFNNPHPDHQSSILQQN